MAGSVIVFRSYDPVEIDLAEAQLRAAEIPHVRVGRGNAALLGVGNYILEQSIGVPPAFVEQAEALLSGAGVIAESELERLLMAERPGAVVVDLAEYRRARREPPPPSRLRTLLERFCRALRC